MSGLSAGVFMEEFSGGVVLVGLGLGLGLGIRGQVPQSVTLTLLPPTFLS